MSHISVPVSRLSVSHANVRKAKPNAEDDQALRASIKAHGLLNNLVVTACDGDDAERYEVIAGGRRYAALCALIEAGDIPEEYLVSCELCEGRHDDGIALSLSENVTRATMHPLDECEAFTALADAGDSVADIALKYGCSEYRIRQRLRLGRVAAEIRQAHREDKIDFDGLMAFAISTDQARQLSVFRDLVENQAL